MGMRADDEYDGYIIVMATTLSHWLETVTEMRKGRRFHLPKSILKYHGARQPGRVLDQTISARGYRGRSWLEDTCHRKRFHT